MNQDYTQIAAALMPQAGDTDEGQFAAHPSGDGSIVREGDQTRLTVDEILAAMNSADPSAQQVAIGVGVDVTAKGAHVCVRQGDAIVYSQFHPAALEAALSAQPAERQVEVMPAELVRWLSDRDLMPDADEDGTFSMDDLLTALNQHEDELLAAHPAAPVGVPGGWKLVPVRPTAEMSRAAHVAWQRVMEMGALRPNDTTMPFVTWDAMLAAAPSAPQGVER